MLSLQTQTPGAIAGEPANVLDRRLRLLSANGTPIAFDDDSGGDHRNASIIYFTPAGSSPASYIVEVSSQTPFAPYGTYLLKMSGQNVDPQPFTATAVSPAPNTAMKTRPTQVTISFNDAIRLSTLQASDLTIDGVPATDVTLLDPKTARFTIAAPADG